MIAEEDAVAGDAQQDENYFVAMADMMVGVLFIFILMLTGFALDFRRTTDAQQTALKAVTDVTDKLDPLQSHVQERIAQLDKSIEDRRALLRNIQTQLQAEGMSVQIDEASGVLRLDEDAVRFQPNRADLLDRNRNNVAKIARVLDRVLPRFAPCRGAESHVCQTPERAALDTVFIEGHTDATGRDDENWELAVVRAVNTYREMITVAPTLRLLKNSRKEEVISVSGYSSTRPVDLSGGRGALDRNRRIDLRFVMENGDRKNLEDILRVANEIRDEIGRLRSAGAAR
jgi:chemotaxis protein MotB